MVGHRQALGLDIGDDAWRVVALRANGAGYELAYAAELPLPADGAAALAAAAREAGNGKHVSVGLPASGCAFKTASLPPGRPAALAQVVQFEAENQFPLPLQELVWGYALTPEPSGRQHAIIAGARRALVDDRLSLLRSAGATPGVLLPAPLAAARTVERTDEPYLLVLAGAEWTDLCRYDGRRLQACRSVLAGDPGAEGWAERLAREIRPWQLADEGLRRIVLLGVADAKAAEALAFGTGLLVTPGDPWRGIGDPQGYLHELDGPPAAYATAIGLAMAALDGTPGINLLPSQLTEMRRQARKLGWALAAWVLALALLAPVAWTSHGKLQHQRQALRDVRAQVREVQRHIETPAPGVLAAQDVAIALGHPESQPLEILRLLSDKLPPGITLANFSYDRGKTVVLKGRAESNPVLAIAVQAINRLPVFERATLDYSTMVKGEGAKGYDFQITCTLPADRNAASGSAARGESRKGRVVR
ncbi:MAG: PilN domain-containing protein [Armatimonadota bacterium]